MTKFLHALLSVFLVISLVVSCSPKVEEDIPLKRAPSSISSAPRETAMINEYGQKIDNLKIKETMARLKKSEQKRFQRQIDNIRKTYNNSVTKLEEFEKAAESEKDEKRRELISTLNQLQINWDYIIKNYDI